MRGCSVTLNGVEVVAGGRRILSIDRLDIGPRGLHFIIGPNGAGKTTLLRSISGLARYRGDIRVCDLTPAMARGRVSYIPASIEADKWARVTEVLKAALYGSNSQDSDGIRYAMRLLGIEDLAYRRFGQLSSGEQRLVMIAAGLARMPSLIVADEPLSHLDIYNQVKVLRVLKDASRDSTVIASTHELIHIYTADTITLLDRGRIAYSGPPEDLDPGLVSRVYGVEITVVNVGGLRVMVPVV